MWINYDFMNPQELQSQLKSSVLFYWRNIISDGLRVSKSPANLHFWVNDAFKVVWATSHSSTSPCLEKLIWAEIFSLLYFFSSHTRVELHSDTCYRLTVSCYSKTVCVSKTESVRSKKTTLKQLDWSEDLLLNYIWCP